MRKIKPLNLMDNKGFWPEKIAIVDAIREVLTLSECTCSLPVRDYGHYRDPEWRGEENDLLPYRSVDWYVYDALSEKRMQVDCRRILKSFAEEPWRDEKMLGDHYDLFVMQEDMFNGAGAQRDYVVGRARGLTAAVISTHRLETMWGMPYSYLKTEVMRQLCFMFGLPNMDREDVHADENGHYCPNRCILRPAHVAPDDWDRLTEDRLTTGALCGSCLDDLRRFFEQAAAEGD
ncbi:MAG: hypothetical protein J7M08_08935 [Planctomycetes bacterium]|nr:hypothetical protein [Planctomycetota bacterium]